MLIRLLGPADVPAAMRLKEAAGWNQTAHDWKTLLQIEPEGCFGIECEGTLAATTTAVCYGRELAWVGMVLTAPEFRRRGLARRLVEHAVEHAVSRGAGRIKLDATDMGAPLYRELGFEDEQPVERWERLPDKAGQEPADETSSGFDAALDREVFGADRSAVLAQIGFESLRIADGAYAMGRPGSRAFYFGPCVSRTADAARLLLRTLVARHERESVYWDLLARNADAVELAQEFGFVRRRELIRMARPGVPGAAPPAGDGACVYAIAGFEYG